MSHPTNTNIIESEKEAQEEKDYHQRLLKQAILTNKVRKQRSKELREIALKCLDRGALSFTHYVTICDRNDLLPF